ncbi:MAG: HAMP domain-containing histidine kinase [Melioribacteraceae bacterium]|nr:HAMP domain-containing histidine kinase [Melioribacteraceae bacterium]
MLIIIPKWATNYNEFWKSVIQRNFWFIKLRYAAVVILLLFLLAGQFILGFKFSSAQTYAISFTAISILLYNIALHSIKNNVTCNPEGFNCLHLSLIQMILDLTALMVLVYYTGIIDSPLYMFFIFHMVIGSMILPGYIMYLSASVVVIVFSILVFMQNFGMIDNNIIVGLYAYPRPHKLIFGLIFITIFAMMLFISIMLANTIANKLYMREQELQDSVDRLGEAEKSKQKYVLGLVHEIKSPLTAIRSILDLVLNQYLGKVENDVMDKLERARIRTNEAINLINNVIRMAKLRLLDIKQIEVFDVLDTIEQVLKSTKELCDSKDVKIELIDNRNDKPFIDFDKLLFHLAISNLICNAIKYNQMQGIIKIYLKNIENGLQIKVIDNGIGIEQQDIERIYKEYIRAKDFNNKTESSGLGLTLVNEIMKQHHGSMEIISPSEIGEPEHPGTEVRLIIPIINGVHDD